MQLQHLVSDEICIQVRDLYERESLARAVGGSVCTAHQRLAAESLYQRRAEHILVHENCFKVLVYKRMCRLTFELLDTEPEGGDDPLEVARWQDYVNKYVDSELGEVVPSPHSKPVFLAR